MADNLEFTIGENFRYIINPNILQVLIIGSPAELTQFYDGFLRTENARIRKQIKPSEYLFPEGTKPTYDNLEDATAGTFHHTKDSEYQKLMSEKMIQLLQQFNPHTPFSDFEQMITRESNNIGGRIDYGNHSYIKIYSRVRPPYILEEDKSIIESVIGPTEIKEGQLAMLFLSTNKKEFDDFYWSIKEVLKYSNAEGAGARGVFTNW